MMGSRLAFALVCSGVAFLATPALAAIQISVDVPRCDSTADICPAPKAVFFDATATACTAGECSDSYRELQYTWDFGDPNAGTWPTGPAAQSKNVDYGPIAFHAWERPGTYTVTLHVTDGSTTASWSRQIYIDDPNVVFSGAKTRCISQTTNFIGCPSGATQIGGSGNDFDALTATAFSAGASRVLFRSDQTWVSSTQTKLPFDTGQIGVFGPSGVGGSERATLTSNGTTFGLDGGRVVNGWAIFNLDRTSGGAFFDWSLNSSNDLLFYKNSVATNGSNVVLFRSDPDQLADDIFWVGDGQTLSGGSFDVPCFFTALGRFVMAGIRFGACERILRMSFDSPLPNDIMGPTIFSHNDATAPACPGCTRNATIDFRGTCGNPDTGSGGHRYALISDNRMTRYDSSHVHLKSVCFQGPPMETSDVIFEGNTAYSSPSGDGWVRNVTGRRVTLRNNVFFTDVASGTMYNSIGNEATAGWVRDNQVINNSIYATGMNRSPIQLDASVDANMECRNNVYWDASGGGHPTCLNASVKSNNASRHPADGLLLLSNPFASTPSRASDPSAWNLNSVAGGGAMLLDAGLPLQSVLTDFTRLPRSGLGYEVGAFEDGSSASPPPPPPASIDPPYLLP